MEISESIGLYAMKNDWEFVSGSLSFSLNVNGCHFTIYHLSYDIGLQKDLVSFDLHQTNTKWIKGMDLIINELT